MSGKRPLPHPHEEQSLAKKTKIDDSDLAESSPTCSSLSTAQTAVTTPSPPPQAMKVVTYTPPDAIEYYYWGLRGTPRLLARSSNQPWTPPTTKEIGYDGNFEKIPKVISVVGRRHPIQAKLDQGLRQIIRHVLLSMEPCRWISVDYVRLGYDQVETNNPVVVLVTVEKNQVPLVEAQRIVDALAQECRRAGLPDVEVEMTEGQRTTNEEGDASSERLLRPIHYPYIGSSIAREGSKGVGSLGGYIQIDGEIMGLTNHHVAFGDRLEAFPTTEEESSGVTYKMLHPAERDLDNYIIHRQADLDWLTETQIQEPSSSHEEEIKRLQLQLEELKSWTPEMCLLGSVWKSSGVRACTLEKPFRFRLDWALIKLNNPLRFLDPTKLVNKAPDYAAFSLVPSQVAIARKAAGQSEMKRLPMYLKRGLALEETLDLQDSAEEEDKKYVVWKFGRTTHYTFGAISGILSDYMSTDGLLSDELLVLDIGAFQSRPFCDKGDSGSFVWDSDGYVSGMLWGGKDKSSQHYITPVQYLLEDIRQVCNAKEVRLVVRREDETDVVFRPPERKSYVGPAKDIDSSIGDIAIADALGAESE